MVTVDYHGRIGNNMFQYTFARLVAERYGLQLMTRWAHPDFIEVAPERGGIIAEGDTVVLRDMYRDDHNTDHFAQDLHGRRVHCSGFFQDHRIYDANKTRVKSYWRVDEVPVNERDVVMHLRLGDYTSPEVDTIIHPTWVHAALNYLRMRRGQYHLYIVTDDPKDRYIAYFYQFNPTIVSNSPREDFNFIRRFKNVLCSPSSFCWWAVYLGHAERVISFPSWMRFSKYINLAYTDGFTPVKGSYYSCRQHAKLKTSGSRMIVR